MRIQENDVNIEKTYFHSASGQDKVQKAQNEQESRSKDIVRQKDGADSQENPSREKPGREELERTLSQMESDLASKNISLKFRVHEESGETQIEVKDPANNKTIRKIPSDDLMKVAANIKELAGTFLDKPV